MYICVDLCPKFLLRSFTASYLYSFPAFQPMTYELLFLKNFLRPMVARPTRPEPKSSMVAGSGTGLTPLSRGCATGLLKVSKAIFPLYFFPSSPQKTSLNLPLLSFALIQLSFHARRPFFDNLPFFTNFFDFLLAFLYSFLKYFDRFSSISNHEKLSPPVSSEKSGA